MSVMVGPSLPPCRLGGVPVHHDPVHGIVANPGNREWGQSPLSFFVVCDNPVHRVLVNWDPPVPAGWRQVPDPTMTEHGICPGASICYIYSGIKLGEEWLFKSWFCQYISLPTKYTISGSILHYKVGLTLSFLSLISRGVGGIQKGNASILKNYINNYRNIRKYTKSV